MRTVPQHLGIAMLAFAVTASAAGQASSAGPAEFEDQLQLTQTSPEPPGAQAVPTTSVVMPSVQTLLDFKESDVKFDLRSLMDVLKDRNHEGWVLAAYPDPKTRRPLIGAGFSLDLPSREHPQRDPLNPHSFLEPSSAELWQAAGLDPDRLQMVLDQYRERFPAQTIRRYRVKIGTLAPEITDQEAILLLRISAIQAIYNAKAYCRNFDRLAAPQQMALSQLVYQMGVNLDEFSEFLKLINIDSSSNDAAAAPRLQNSIAADSEYWRVVQQSLIQSQWARLYRSRAVSVIAMLDPQYLDDPVIAERRVGATLRPAVVHGRRGRARASHQFATNGGSRRKAIRQKAAGTRNKQRA